MDADWKKIRKEYLQGGISLRKLAAKYGMQPTTLQRVATREKWTQKREQSVSKACAKTADAIAEKDAQIDTGVYDAAQLLLRKFSESVSACDVVTPDQAQKYGSALRSIQQVLDSRPKQLDVEEQMARIEKLRKETQVQNETQSITVVLEGGLEEYGS